MASSSRKQIRQQTLAWAMYCTMGFKSTVQGVFPKDFVLRSMLIRMLDETITELRYLIKHIN